jgi:autotransporter-associated beta strand protein
LERHPYRRQLGHQRLRNQLDRRPRHLRRNRRHHRQHRHRHLQQRQHFHLRAGQQRTPQPPEHHLRHRRRLLHPRHRRRQRPLPHRRWHHRHRPHPRRHRPHPDHQRPRPARRQLHLRQQLHQRRHHHALRRRRQRWHRRHHHPHPRRRQHRLQQRHRIPHLQRLRHHLQPHQGRRRNWTLSGATANSYNGTTTVNNGTLLLNNSGGVAVPGNLTLQPVTGSGPIVVRLLANNQVASTATVTVGTGSGISNGNNQFDLNGFNNTIGALVFSPLTSGQTVQVTTGAGTLTLGGNISVNGNNSNPLTLSGKLALGGTSGATVINGSNSGSTKATLTISAQISGSNTLTQAYVGSVVLSATNNTLTGQVITQSGPISVPFLSVSGTADSLGNQTGSNRTIGFGGVTGFSGTLTYTGPTTSTDRPIVIGTNDGGTGALNNNSAGTLTWTGSLSGPHSFFLSGSGTGGVFQGVISLTAGALHKSGSGVWTLNGGATNSTYTTPLAIDQGTFSVATVNNASTNGVFGNSTNAVSISTTTATGTLQYTGATTSNNKTFSLTSGTSTTSNFDVNTLGTILTLTGSVGGPGNLTKVGAGTLALTNDTYTGNTSVNAGTLAITLPNLSATSSVSIASSAVLNLNFTDNTVNDTVASLLFNGVSEPAGTYNASNSSGFITGTGNIVVAAPEPSALGVLLLPAIAWTSRRRRRRQA